MKTGDELKREALAAQLERTRKYIAECKERAKNKEKIIKPERYYDGYGKGVMGRSTESNDALYMQGWTDGAEWREKKNVESDTSLAEYDSGYIDGLKDNLKNSISIHYDNGYVDGSEQRKKEQNQ
jgi:hypothetical protein